MIYVRTQSMRVAQGVTILICLSAVWLSASCNAADLRTLESSAKPPMPRFSPHEILVKFKEGVPQERIAFILKNNYIKVIAEIQRGHLYHVRVLGTRSVESAIAQLISYREIEYAEPNYRYQTEK
jgi:hypothetical protein